jgi:hypothetical protein
MIREMISSDRPQLVAMRARATLTRVRRPLVSRIGTGGHWLSALDDYGKLYPLGFQGI